MATRKKKEQAGEQEERFDQLMDSLGKIVQSLEQADLPLEESLLQFEEGIALSRRGQAILDAAEERVETLLADGSTAPVAADGDGRERDGKDTGDHR